MTNSNAANIVEHCAQSISTTSFKQRKLVVRLPTVWSQLYCMPVNKTETYCNNQISICRHVSYINSFMSYNQNQQQMHSCVMINIHLQSVHCICNAMYNE